jgi:hypothetical protein
MRPAAKIGGPAAGERLARSGQCGTRRAARALHQPLGPRQPDGADLARVERAARDALEVLAVMGPQDLPVGHVVGHAKIPLVERAAGEQPFAKPEVLPARKRMARGQRKRENVAVK